MDHAPVTKCSIVGKTDAGNRLLALEVKCWRSFETAPTRYGGLTNDGDRGWRLVVHHGNGSWVETFANMPQALRRVQDLEEMLAHARKK
jgi:hypothetical protein